MKDLERVEGIEEILAAWQAGDIEGIAATLHRDFTAFGREEGLFVQADRQTFLSHAKSTVLHKAPRLDIRWCDAHGPLAAVCLIQRRQGALKATMLTLLKSGEGWQVMTATFAVWDEVNPAIDQEFQTQ